MRSIGANALAASTSQHVNICLLLEFHFAEGVERYALAGQDISYGGYTWAAGGHVANIETTRESIAPEATGLKLSLSGAFGPHLQKALTSHIRGRQMIMYIAFLNDAGQVLDAPVEECVYLMDTLSVEDRPDGTSTIMLTCENEASRFSRPAISRHNDADQQRRFPGDRFYEYLPNMIEAPVVFPSREWQILMG